MGKHTVNGWVIIDGNSEPSNPLYYTITNARIQWSPDSEHALRFAREEDAKAFTSLSEWASHPTRIAYRTWG